MKSGATEAGSKSKVNNNSKTNSNESKANNIEESLLEKWYDQLDLIKEKTGIQGSYVIIGILTMVFFVYCGIMEKFITNMVGTIYPVFYTIDTLEHHTGDDKQWLTYWIVFSIFTIIDMFSGFVLKIVPFYFIAKIMFLIWCFMPNTQGATIIYNLIISRVFDAYEKDFESVTEDLKSELSSFISREKKDDVKKKKSS